MNSFSGVWPSRNFSASLSKSSNSRSRIGITWPGTSSRTSGFSSDPLRPCVVEGSIAAQSTTLEADRDLFFESRPELIPFKSMPRSERPVSHPEAVDRFGEDRLALAASWQKETAVLVDLVRRSRPGGADLHARHRRAVRGDLRHLALGRGALRDHRRGLSRRAGSTGMWATDPDRCCFLRKVEPLERALADADCWISGVRRDQSPERAEHRGARLGRAPRPVEGEPARDWTEQRRLGLHRATRPPLQPAARPGLRLDRLHALHAPGARARRPLGRARQDGVRDPRPRSGDARRVCSAREDRQHALARRRRHARRTAPPRSASRARRSG